MHLVMQRQGMIALAPIIPDAVMLFDHQRIQPKLAKPRGDAKPRLPRANHQHNGVSAGEGFCLFALIEPIIAAEIARIGFSARPALAGFFLKTLEFFKRCQQHPGLCGVIQRQPQHAIASAKAGFKMEDRFNHLKAKPLHAARRCACFRQREAMRPNRRLRLCQRYRDIMRAHMRRDVPGEGEQIAPMALGRKKRSEASRISRLKRGFKTLQPTGHQSRIIRARAKRAISHMIHGVSRPGIYLRAA